MNLTSDPWIPVIYRSGETKCISLLHLYKQGDHIVDLHVIPPTRVAITSLLLAITNAALDGPDTESEWEKSYELIAPKAVKYLEANSVSFELYGEGAFLQVPQFKPLNNAVHDKLLFSLSSGDNTTLFDSDANPSGRQFIDAWVARNFITFQGCSPGGRIGVGEWGSSPTPGKGSSEQAPLCESSALSVIIRGENIIKTIHWNIMSKELIGKLPGVTWGRPNWELDLSSPETQDAKESVKSYLGHLAPVSRAMKLDENSNKVSLTNGLSYTKLPIYRNPLCPTYVSKNDEIKYIRVDPNKHAWRNISAILSLNYPGSGSPYALSRFITTNESTINLWVGGTAIDKGKIIDNGEWEFVVPAKMLHEDCLKAYTLGVAYANSVASCMAKSLITFQKALSMESAPYKNQATNQYWGQLDNTYSMLFEIAFGGQALDEWKKYLANTAKDIINAVCPKNTGRENKAFTECRKSFSINLKKVDDE